MENKWKSEKRKERVREAENKAKRKEDKQKKQENQRSENSKKVVKQKSEKIKGAEKQINKKRQSSKKNRKERKKNESRAGKSRKKPAAWIKNKCLKLYAHALEKKKKKKKKTQWLSLWQWPACIVHGDFFQLAQAMSKLADFAVSSAFLFVTPLGVTDVTLIRKGDLYC